jgi:AhpD family alkylhydroperoxidase
MKHPVFLLPDAMQGLLSLSHSAQKTGLSPVLLEMVHLRASQINGCSRCVVMHARDLKKAGESDDRVAAVAAWREAPYFSDAERAALELTEAVTRVADRGDPVPDALWDQARRHYDEPQLAGLLVSIATINVWNRLNAATRQPAEM